MRVREWGKIEYFAKDDKNINYCNCFYFIIDMVMEVFLSGP